MASCKLKQVSRAIQLLRPFVQPKRYNTFLQVISQRTKAVRIVLENIRDPQNASACLRTGDGYGIQYFDLIETINNFKLHVPEKPLPGASTGVDKWVTLLHHTNAKSCFQELKKENYVVVGSSLAEGSQLLTEIIDDLRMKEITKYSDNSTEAPKLLDVPLPKIALVFGNEVRGLSKAIQSRCDYTFKIPMYGFVQSFNIGTTVAMALAILEHLQVFRKPGHTAPLFNRGEADDIENFNRAIAKSNSNKAPDLLDEQSTTLDPNSFWSTNITSNFLNYPLDLVEKNELLLKWIFRSVPYSEKLWKQNSIELDIL